MSATTQFCAHIARIKGALAADSPVNVEQTIKGLLAQYGLGELAVVEPVRETSKDVVLRCLGVGANADKMAYFVDGEWIYVPHEKQFFGDVKFKDALCPACQKHEREKQLTK